MDDLDEFLAVVGTEVSTHRMCSECDELYIVNPDTYDKPKTQCDPDGYCPFWVPICLCKGGDTIYDWESLEECKYPNCECGHGEQVRGP